MIFVLFLLLAFTHGVKLPDGLILCHKNDPKFSDCIGNSVKLALQIFANGYRPLRIPVLEPLFVNKLEINEAPTPAVAILQKYTNFFIHGMTRSNISNMRMELDKGCGWTMNVSSPHLYLIGDLKMQGKFLMFPLNSNGKCNISLANAWHYHTMQCETFSKNEKTHLKFVNYSLDVHAEFIHFNFTNLFPSNRQIETVIGQAMNDNSMLLFNDIKGGFEEAFSIFFMKMANLVFGKIPMDEVFLS